MTRALGRGALSGVSRRQGPAAPPLLLPDGRVLVAGGWGSGQGFGPKLASAELYDPATRAWTMTGAMSQLRHGHTATLLPNGTVLVAGGGNDTGRLASAELYDPAAGIWTMTGSLPEPFGGDATLLPDGTVLIAGGDVPRGPGAVASAHAAVYDPATGTWAVTASMGTPRLSLASVMLPDGRVLVTGGRMNGGLASERLSSAELYDPVSGTWTATKDMSVARSGHTATLPPGWPRARRGRRNPAHRRRRRRHVRQLTRLSRGLRPRAVTHPAPRDVGDASGRRRHARERHGGRAPPGARIDTGVRC